MSETSFKRGDFVKCVYGGTNYVGHLVADSKKGLAEIKVNLASKRAAAPMYDIITVPLEDVQELKVK